MCLSNTLVLSAKFTLKDLIRNMPQQGRVEWIGVRPYKKAPLQAVDTVRVLVKGLQGDHYAGQKQDGNLGVENKSFYY